MSENISTSAPGTQSKSEKPSTPKKKLKKKQLDDKLSVSLSKCVSTWTMIGLYWVAICWLAFSLNSHCHVISADDLRF